MSKQSKKNKKSTLLQEFFFSDVVPLMENLGSRQAEKQDLNSIPYVKQTLDKKDDYPGLDEALIHLRKSPFLAIFRFEKKSFIYMFWIHLADILISLTSALLAIQILRNFESDYVQSFHLITLFYDTPTTQQKFFFTACIALFVFALNIVATALHAQKIEREMLLSWRIPFKLMQYVYQQLLNICKKDRDHFRTGDITNMVQTDAQALGSYFSHAMVDIPLMFISCGLITVIMFFIVGKLAWIGLTVMCLQVPLALFFSWLGRVLHHEFMRRADLRLQLVSEWITGMRLLRYFGWEKYFKKEIENATLSEFIQSIKLSLKYSFSFALTMNWWMVMSSAVFAGIAYTSGQKDAATIFAIIWLSGLFSQQLTPLPWFVNIFSQALVASKRLKNFYQSKLQIEEFKDRDKFTDQENSWIERIFKEEKVKNILISFSWQNVSLRFSENEPYVIKNISLDIQAGKTLAIVGPVASGKSIFIQLMMGDFVPTSGKILFQIKGKFSEGDDFSFSGNVHTQTGIELLRLFQAYVPQEPFIISSSIRENVHFSYKKEHEDEPQNDQNSTTNENEVMNALYAASFHEDLHNFRHGIFTEIGERGVNLSGGQKQRISLARSAFLNSHLIFFDDPLSAVDVNTEKELAGSIFHSKWAKEKTVIWATHRLEFLSYADEIIFLEAGSISEQGSYADLIQKESKLKDFIFGNGYQNKI